MKMPKYITICLEIADGVDVPRVEIGATLLGHKVTAAAAYDAINALEVAEDGLQASGDGACMDALSRMHDIKMGRI